MSITYSSLGLRCYYVVRASTTNVAAWLRHRIDCAFLLERHEPYGISSSCAQSCTVCVYATVCLTVIPLFSDITDVSTISHSFKTDVSRTPFFHVVQYGDYK